MISKLMRKNILRNKKHLVFPQDLKQWANELQMLMWTLKIDIGLYLAFIFFESRQKDFMKRLFSQNFYTYIGLTEYNSEYVNATFKKSEEVEFQKLKILSKWHRRRNWFPEKRKILHTYVVKLVFFPKEGYWIEL